MSELKVLALFLNGVELNKKIVYIRFSIIFLVIGSTEKMKLTRVNDSVCIIETIRVELSCCSMGSFRRRHLGR